MEHQLILRRRELELENIVRASIKFAVARREMGHCLWAVRADRDRYLETQECVFTLARRSR